MLYICRAVAICVSVDAAFYGILVASVHDLSNYGLAPPYRLYGAFIDLALLTNVYANCLIYLTDIFEIQN